MDSKQGLVYRRSLLAEFFRGAIMGRVKTATSWEGSHPFFAELSGDMCYHLNSTHLDVAKEELAKFHVIGLQERFDASLVWAAFELKWSPSELVYDRKAYASATTNESVSKGPVRSYKDNRKKIALRRPKAADLPPKLAARINSSPRYQLEREFYKHALELHTERTAKLPGFAQQVEVFVSACNQAGQKAARVKGTRHTSR